MFILEMLFVLMKLKFTLQTQSASSTLQKHKSSSSFTPFIDPRLLQISPSSGTTVTSVGEYSQDRKEPTPGQGPFALFLMAQHGTGVSQARPGGRAVWEVSGTVRLPFPCVLLAQYLLDGVSCGMWTCP